MSAILLDNAIVHFEVLGRGRPLIFLHTWIGSWRYWISTMQATSTSHRAYALDLWGFGESAKDNSRYSLEQQLALLDGFITQMGIQKCSLVGHGLGSILALYYAAGYLEKLERLMLVSFPAGLQSINPRLISGPQDQAAGWLLGRSKDSRTILGEAAKADPLAISASIGQYGQVNWQQLALQAQIRSLWIFGRNDPLVSAPANGAGAYLPEQAHLLLFDRCGHYPMLEEPHKFNRVLAEFLALDPAHHLRQIQIKEEWKRRVR